MKKDRVIVLVSLVLFVAALMVATGMGGPKIYWHFTFKAFVHLPDTSAQEWAWVTMVEFEKDKAYPDETATARQYGGVLQGIVFAQVRGAAWRSSHRYERDTRCHDRPAKKEIFWEESDSESVFGAGQFFAPRPDRDAGTGTLTLGPDQFRFMFTNRKILHENGSWEDLRSQARVFVGAVNVEGRPSEETKGDFYLQVVNYRDNLEHHRRCEKAWVEQYLTAFSHFNHNPLEDDIPAVGDSVWGQVPFGPDNVNNIVWEVHRSTSREHPHWKQKAM